MQPVEAQIEVEYYNVLYTKHINQKHKVWEDGFMEYRLKNYKVRFD